MQSKLTIGMDIGKAEVVVACHESAFAVLKMANAVPVLRRWLATLPAGSRLGLEATGGYHEPVAELAHSLGFTVYIRMHRSLPLTWPNTTRACMRSCP